MLLFLEFPSFYSTATTPKELQTTISLVFPIFFSYIPFTRVTNNSEGTGSKEDMVLNSPRNVPILVFDLIFSFLAGVDGAEIVSRRSKLTLLSFLTKVRLLEEREPEM